jgi:putative ABC transport system permease protein
MNWVALKMLTGDRAKYLGIVFGVAFATLLMAQQTSIFVGVMLRTTSQIRDVADAGIWVMDPRVQYVEEVRPLPDTDLERVRGVPGVAWAVPYSRALVQARVEDGTFRQVLVLGLDDATLVGGPRRLVLGSLADLRTPDAVLVDETGFRLLWPGEPLRLGKTLEVGERRAVVAGVCKASAPFQSMPIVYTGYATAVRFSPSGRHHLSFVLARTEPGRDARAVCADINRRTGLLALTTDDFSWRTVGYYLGSTGIPINFGITVALGFVVGLAIAGQTFYLFTVENLKQFGALKAMGVSDRGIVSMILLQALVVGLLGYGLGMGATALFFMLTQGFMHLRGLFLPWQVMAGTAAAVGVIVVASSLLSVRRVLVLEPAVVFRG